MRSDLFVPFLRYGVVRLLGVVVSLLFSRGQAEDGGEARLGVLLDTSAGMGFLVPQVRKEIRILNQFLEEAGREKIILRELEGASLDREASLSVPGTKNALYAFRGFYEEDRVDTVCWITSLQGMQSGAGLFALEKLLKAESDDRPRPKLVIRNIWQGQVLAGDSWLRNPPEPGLDRLDPVSRPDEWYRLVAERRGIIIRSWQTPPAGHLAEFGFPWRVRHSGFLRKAGYTAPVEFDFSWARSLRERHRLHFLGEKEEWPSRITGRSWVLDHSLVPFPDSIGTEWDEPVFAELCARDSIEDDLGRIGAERIGVLGAFGYVRSDLDRFQAGEERARKKSSFLYLQDIARFVQELRENQSRWEESGRKDRCYALDFLEVDRASRKAEGIDPVARRIAGMVRDEKVDAVYLFTNGYHGGGNYGSFTIDLEMIERAIREAGTRLFVRVPFETGAAPAALQKLAIASGGRVFLGKEGDPDWEMGEWKGQWIHPEAKPR